MSELFKISNCEDNFNWKGKEKKREEIDNT